MAGFWNNFQDRKTAFDQLLGHRRLSEGRNKLPKEGYKKDFTICEWILPASSNFSFDFLHKQAAKNCEERQHSSKKFPI